MTPAKLQAAVVSALRTPAPEGKPRWTPPLLGRQVGAATQDVVAAIQSLRFAGKIKFESLALSASMLAVEEGPASGGLGAPGPAEPEAESAPPPANPSQAKARDEAQPEVAGCVGANEPMMSVNGAAPAERVSRPAAGRSAAATSERMDVTAGETAPAASPEQGAAGSLSTSDPASGNDPSAGCDTAGGVLHPLAPPASLVPPEPAVGPLELAQVRDFIAAIDVYLARTGMQGWELGRFVLDHAGFWPLLNKRQTARWETVVKILAFMDRWPRGATREQVMNARGETAAHHSAATRARSIKAAPGNAAVASSLQEQVAAEATARVASRRAAQSTGSVVSAHKVNPVVEAIQTAFLEQPEDGLIFLRRRWKDLLSRLLVLGRVSELTPGPMLVEALDVGLSELEERALAKGLLEDASTPLSGVAA